MHYLLFILLGLGASAHVVVINIADYPPPELVGRLWGVLVAGPVASLVAGSLLREMIAGSDPMPGLAAILGVIGAGLGASAATALAAGFAKKTQMGR